MTPDEFRSIAISLPEATESAHMGHPDFRIGGKIFATLQPDNHWGMVKLPAGRQSEFVRAAPEVFELFAGAWGRQGATKVHLERADVSLVRQALIAAWRNIAPRRVAEQFDEELD